MELPYDPEILLLEIYPKKLETLMFNISTPVFTALLFPTAKIWKQPYVYPSVDERIKKLWYIYTIEHYSAIKKKKGNLTLCDSMDGPEEHYAK